MAAVVLDDPDAAGLDAMLAALLAAAIERPDKARLLDAMSGTVTVDVPDAEVAVGLRFAGGVCRVYSRSIPASMVRITVPSEVLLGMSTLPLVAGLPSVLAPDGRAFLRRLLTREVRVRGLRHVVFVSRLNRLLSVT